MQIKHLIRILCATVGHGGDSDRHNSCKYSFESHASEFQLYWWITQKYFYFNENNFRIISTGYRLLFPPTTSMHAHTAELTAS